MTQLGFTISGDWKLFDRFLTSTIFSRNAEREIRRAMIKSSLYIIKKVKSEIRSKAYTENQPLTLALSRGTIPLLKDKNLWDAIEYKLHSSFLAEIGILRDANSTGGVTGKSTSMYKLAELMHTGYTIKVTHKMIIAILAALNEQRTKKGRLTAKAKRMIRQIEKNRKFKDPDKRSKQGKLGQWRVPPRPYMKKVMEDEDIDAMVRRNWKEALERAYKAQGAKGGEHRYR